MKRIKRKNAKKKITIIAIIVAILWLFGFYIYVTYSKIEIKSGNYEATKVQSTESAQTVEKVEEKSQTIADIIEETTKLPITSDSILLIVALGIIILMMIFVFIKMRKTKNEADR